MSGVSPDPSGITDDMTEAAARAHAAHEGYDWSEVSEFWQRRYLAMARVILAAGLAGRAVVDQDADAEHLQMSTSERGFKRLPALPASYPGSKVAVYESSAARAPHLWVLVEDTDGSEAHAHLTLDTALKLVQQVIHLINNHYQVPLGLLVGVPTNE